MRGNPRRMARHPLSATHQRLEDVVDLLALEHQVLRLLLHPHRRRPLTTGVRIHPHEP